MKISRSWAIAGKKKRAKSRQQKGLDQKPPAPLGFRRSGYEPGNENSWHLPGAGW